MGYKLKEDTKFDMEDPDTYPQWLWLLAGTALVIGFLLILLGDSIFLLF